MKFLQPSKLFLLVPAALVCLAQEPIKPGTPAPKPVAADPASVPPDTVVLAVGNEKVTKAQFEALLQELPEQVRTQATGPNRRKLAEQLADVKAMAQEARKRKLEQSVGVQQMINLQVDNALASILFKNIQDGVKPDDAALKAYFDSHKNDYEEAKASHILIRFQGSPVPLKEGQKDLSQEQALAKANDIRKKILAGGNFADLAKAESDDAGSGAQGGSLGTFGHGQMVPEFEKAAFTLPVGQVSEPIKTQFGYHIVKVEERNAKSFDMVKGDIEKNMKPAKAKEAVDDIRKQSTITLNDTYFGK